jgi:hypothetical protein
MCGQVACSVNVCFLPIPDIGAGVRFRPIADIGQVCEPLLMNARGFLIVFVVVACLLALMFYSGMFMHGDPVEQP